MRFSALPQLTHELPLFAPDLESWNLPDPLPAAAWNALLGPPSERSPFTRTLFFGRPFALLCIVGCVRFARRHADLVLIVAACTVLLFTALLPMSFVSARFHFRDPLILAAIPLAGLTLDRLLVSPRWRPVALLVLIAQVGALCAVAWPAAARTWVPAARRAE